MAKDKKKKTPRPKALPPKGFRDYFNTDVSQRTKMLAQISDVYHHYGFDPLESPAIETVEALGKFLPDVDRPNEGVFAWQDEDDAWMALRYDLTAPLARVYAQFRSDLPNPYRRYAMGPVWRNEKPGPGRYRQFYQCDADTVGTPSIAADAEICMMLADTLETVGIAHGDYIIRINNRKILNGILETIHLGTENPTQRNAVLRTIDKFDKIGKEGVRQLLTKGRLDSSGAYIDGVDLSDSQADPVIAFLTSKAQNTTATLSNLRSAVGKSDIGRKGIEELEEIGTLLAASGYEADRINIDPSVVRGLGYYTGPVFEAELTFEILDEKGRKRQYGSVSGGGRYDDLVKRFIGQEIPATGISIGVDRLLNALHEKRKTHNISQGPVIVTVMDQNRITDYQQMVNELRAGGIRAEMYLGNPRNFGNQLKYADKRQSPVAIIQGSDENAKGVLQIKDLALGARLSEKIETAQEWKAQPAQIEIPRSELVSQVLKMIARSKTQET